MHTLPQLELQLQPRMRLMPASFNSIKNGWESISVHLFSDSFLSPTPSLPIPLGEGDNGTAAFPFVCFSTNGSQAAQRSALLWSLQALQGRQHCRSASWRTSGFPGWALWRYVAAADLGALLTGQLLVAVASASCRGPHSRYRVSALVIADGLFSWFLPVLNAFLLVLFGAR